MGTDVNPYYYWVTAYNIAGDSTPPSEFGSIANISCSAKLDNSDKEITAINGANVSPAPQSCNAGSTPLSATNVVKLGDKLKFAINLCNDQGLRDATQIFVKDTFTNLKLPNGQPNFNAVYNGLALTYDGVQASTYVPAPGHYAASGSVPNQVLVFNLSNDAIHKIPAGAIRTLTLEAELAIPAGFSGDKPRFMNGVHVDFIKDGVNPGTADFFIPLQIFYAGSGQPTIIERP